MELRLLVTSQHLLEYSSKNFYLGSLQANPVWFKLSFCQFSNTLKKTDTFCNLPCICLLRLNINFPNGVVSWNIGKLNTLKHSCSEHPSGCQTANVLKKYIFGVTAPSQDRCFPSFYVRPNANLS